LYPFSLAKGIYGIISLSITGRPPNRANSF
jgi:hypothetical protein